MDSYRNFLLNWLFESEPMLGDELDREELDRLTNEELYALSCERSEKLRQTAEAKHREAEALRMYGRRKRAGIQGVIAGKK